MNRPSAYQDDLNGGYIRGDDLCHELAERPRHDVPEDPKVVMERDLMELRVAVAKFLVHCPSSTLCHAIINEVIKHWEKTIYEEGDGDDENQ